MLIGMLGMHLMMQAPPQNEQPKGFWRLPDTCSWWVVVAGPAWTRGEGSKRLSEGSIARLSYDLLVPGLLSASALHMGTARGKRVSDLGDKAVHCMGCCLIPSCALHALLLESVGCCKSFSRRWVLLL